MRAAPEYIGGL